MQSPDTLRSVLKYEPRELRFGTSGRRGEVKDLTQLEIYINVLAELEYLQSIPVSAGGITRGDEFYLAYDLRPSSTQFVAGEQDRGEIFQAAVQAVRDSGMRPVNLGAIPTPALANYAFTRQAGSIMVTGSHIPFDRNGYKLNKSRGELMKTDEAPVGAIVKRVRERLYSQRAAASAFDENGRLKTGHSDLLPADEQGRNAYVRRYVEFFSHCRLNGWRILVYEHSAVGRDVLVEILQKLGAEVIPCGRSDMFVPIDTENVDAAQLSTIQRLAEEAARHGQIDAIVSLDGDSDRPMVLGWDSGRVRFFGGDLLGMITAEYLGADSVVVPITCNDAIDRGPLAGVVEPKTRVGSPYVIAGMESARKKGRRAVCGWEANGGFLTGADIHRRGRTLAALPTRDAVLPILSVLAAAQEQNKPLPALFDRLPPRFSRSALLRPFPIAAGLALTRHFSIHHSDAKDIRLQLDKVTAMDGDRVELPLSNDEQQQLESVRRDLSQVFSPRRGFGPIAGINYTDGVRITFGNSDVAHFRPSGNADELRIYAVAGTQARAEEICAMSIASPDGLLMQLAALAGAEKPQ